MSGCLQHCRISPLTDEIFICGETKLGGKTWLCDDCVQKKYAPKPQDGVPFETIKEMKCKDVKILQEQMMEKFQ